MKKIKKYCGKIKYETTWIIDDFPRIWVLKFFEHRLLVIHGLTISGDSIPTAAAGQMSGHKWIVSTLVPTKNSLSKFTD